MLYLEANSDIEFGFDAFAAQIESCDRIRQI